MSQQSRQAEHHADDSDFQKGAIEGAPDGQGNANAQDALGDDGLPSDKVKIAQDVLGANEDETQG
jgi:hypothetical protein